MIGLVTVIEFAGFAVYAFASKLDIVHNALAALLSSSVKETEVKLKKIMKMK